ncbi:unnamed protein product [Pseudo-nitzschia multistriata]|uniref:Sister chromatid cohesion protein DCC1 n=1 Tax=Pseudo-nitzschia multistriata TaxID=183589 RepID=A0A448Z3D2_9STRA|nr:unnamed protein product [Pseudo-nitzschia multistriata]
MPATSPSTGERGILLSLPRCDMERPDAGTGGPTAAAAASEANPKKSMKTTAKRADLVLFKLPASAKNQAERGETLSDDVLGGRSRILASPASACLVTPSASLKLVSIGTSNALVVWKADTDTDTDAFGNETRASPAKRARTSDPSGTLPAAVVAPCRLVQPGGSGSSFLVGQPHDPDQGDLARFFEQRGPSLPPVSTAELCNLFQAAPGPLWKALEGVHAVVSHCAPGGGEAWFRVEGEEVLKGQRALVEFLCEEDEDFEAEGGSDASLALGAVADRVGKRLAPLLADKGGPAMGREERSLAIARKTVLLASAPGTTGGSKAWRDVRDRRFRPDASKIAFCVLRDLFSKYPSYAWSDLSEQWSSRLPLGERYERITSTTEWIEDPDLGGHGGLVPDQLVFSPSAAGDAGGGEGADRTTGKKGSGAGNNPKGVLGLVDPHAVLVWRGG